MTAPSFSSHLGSSSYRTPPNTWLDFNATIVPQIYLFLDRVVIDRGDGISTRLDEAEVPLVALSFRYPTGIVRASDPAERFFCAKDGVFLATNRDFDAEARARYLLERFGAVDLQCVEHYAIPPNTDADYLLRIDGNAHSHCAFFKSALPELQKLGFAVEVDPDYPYQVFKGDPPWYAVLGTKDEKPDWFGLELGVEVEGSRVSLLPALLSILDRDEGTGSLPDLVDDPARSYALRANETHHVMVSGERMRAMLRVVVELYKDQSGRALGGCDARSAATVSRMVDVFEAEGQSLDLEDPKGWRKRGGALMARPGETCPPNGLRATLRPYQQEGLAWLQHLRECGVGGVLADDMGLGKTLQTIAHLAKESDRVQCPSLVVAPTSLVENWQREFQRFAPHKHVLLLHGVRRHDYWEDVPAADVVVTSYPLVVRDQERLAEYPFHMLVLDEAHAIKNARSQVHQAVRTIDAKHRICLTGTPVENHLGELWSLFDFLNKGLLGDEHQFSRWYRKPIERDGDAERLDGLQQLVQPYILRRVKKDVAKELPPKTVLAVPLELQGKQRDLYEHIRVAAHAQVRQVIKKKGVRGSTIPILDALMKLRQVCCDPRLVPMQAARFVRESAKYAYLMQFLNAQLEQGHRILVFSQFTQML
ncbi:MAG: SNF2-related protein, partial [Myxococcota bacterium]